MRQYTKEYVNKLLNRFMEGTSTLEEEGILSQYFAQSHIPAEWEQYRLLFKELEAMEPAAKPKRRWLRWGVAAATAVMALLAAWTSVNHPSNEPLIAVNKTEQKDSVMPITTQGGTQTDTINRHQWQTIPEKSRKRSLRKQQPTMTDYDKGYALMARMQQERQQVEQQIAQTQQEIIHARLTAAGYVAIQQEDGSIIYIEEPKDFFVYEE